MALKDKIIHLLGGYTSEDVRKGVKQPESVPAAKGSLMLVCPHKIVTDNCIYCALGKFVTKCYQCDCPDKKFIPCMDTNNINTIL